MISGLSGLATKSAFAQSDFFVYPQKGQSHNQQEKDQYQCYEWAKNQTGFDPMKTPTATAPPPQEQAKKGGVGRGAVGGALLWLGIGSISGDAGKGAAIGGLAGGVFGGVRRTQPTSATDTSGAAVGSGSGCAVCP